MLNQAQRGFFLPGPSGFRPIPRNGQTKSVLGRDGVHRAARMSRAGPSLLQRPARVFADKFLVDARAGASLIHFEISNQAFQ